MILWGKQKGKQRFKCKSCGLLFTRQNKEVTFSNQFVWFRKWVLNRQTLSYISDESGYSIRTLKRLFARYLDRAPTLKFFPRERLNLLIDATYFSNDICLVIYRDNQVGVNVFLGFSVFLGFAKQLRRKPLLLFLDFMDDFK